jgi:hypothetical protein
VPATARCGDRGQAVRTLRTITKLSQRAYESVAARWQELDFGGNAPLVSIFEESFPRASQADAVLQRCIEHPAAMSQAIIVQHPGSLLILEIEPCRKGSGSVIT